jgi:hypothetical protein
MVLIADTQKDAKQNRKTTHYAFAKSKDVNYLLCGMGFSSP